MRWPFVGRSQARGPLRDQEKDSQARGPLRDRVVVGIVSTGHDIADARLHRTAAALCRAGCEVWVRALVEPASPEPTVETSSPLVEPTAPELARDAVVSKPGEVADGGDSGAEETSAVSTPLAELAGSTSDWGFIADRRVGKVRRGLRALIWPWQARCDVLITIDPDTALSAWLSSRVLRRRWVADVHEDYRELLRDRAWVPTPLLAVLRGAVSVLNRIIMRADLVLVADEHVPPRAARRRFVMRNVPDVTLLPPMPPLVEPAAGGGAGAGDASGVSTPLVELAGSTNVDMGSTNVDMGSTNVDTGSASGDGRSGDGWRAVYIGDNRTSRGLRDMVEAIAATADDSAPWRLDLVGPVAAADREWLDERLTQPDTRNVAWHGRRPPAESWQIAAGADVGLCLLADTPAFRDAMPSKVYEYLAMGMPTVATPLPRVRDLVEGTGSGVIVDGVPATVEALRRFATDAAHRHALVANARAAGQELRERPSPYDEAARLIRATAVDDA